jgi:hypothetical protein
MVSITCDCRRKTCISCVYFGKVELPKQVKQVNKKLEAEENKTAKSNGNNGANAPSVTGRYW